MHHVTLLSYFFSDEDESSEEETEEVVAVVQRVAVQQDRICQLEAEETCMGACKGQYIHCTFFQLLAMHRANHMQTCKLVAFR